VAEQTSSSIEIAARPEEILNVIADFPTYPEWVDSISAADVLSSEDGRPKIVHLVLNHPMVKDDYVLSFDWAPSIVSWHLVQGKLLKALDGSYLLTPSGERTTVTYTLKVDTNLPMIGPFKRKAEKSIIDGALSALKNRVEG